MPPAHFVGLARDFYGCRTVPLRSAFGTVYGDEPHHIVEALFKAFARAVDVDEDGFINGVGGQPVAVAETELNYAADIVGIRGILLSRQGRGPLLGPTLEMRVARHLKDVPHSAGKIAVDPAVKVIAGHGGGPEAVGEGATRKHVGASHLRHGVAELHGGKLQQARQFRVGGRAVGVDDHLSVRRLGHLQDRQLVGGGVLVIA